MKWTFYFTHSSFRLEQDDDVAFEYRAANLGASSNIMDKWILSFTQSLVKFVKQEMAGALPYLGI